MMAKVSLSFEVSANNERPIRPGRFSASPPMARSTIPRCQKSPTCRSAPIRRRRSRASAVSSRRARHRRAYLRNQAALNDASDSTRATAETSARQRVNGILSAHQIVTVTGAGSINSGDYFLSSVTHAIDPSAHKMRLEMMRNAPGAPS